MEPLRDDDPAEIGGYRLRARLGAGGMGRVYLASTAGGRPVALKVVHAQLSDDRGFRARFRLEIQAARRVHGLYTAEVLNADPDATPPWLVTAYVPGPSLEDAVASDGPMAAETVLLVMAGVAEALQAIHSAGVVHRDLKPSNVLLSPDGPRVIDFGIARATEGVKLTRNSISMGSPQYMAPEQIRAQPVTPAIDIFALGSLAAFAVLGRVPFGDDNPAAVMHRVLYESPDLDGCPAALRSMIEHCLAKEPVDRPAPAGIIEFSRAQSAQKPAEFPPSWPLDIHLAGAGYGPGRLPGSLASAPARHVAAAIPATDVADADFPIYTGAQLPFPAPSEAGTTRQIASAEPSRRALWAVWFMYGSATLAIVGLVVSVAAVPALRTMLHQQHPAASARALSAAVRLAVMVLVIRGLVSTGLWWWAAQETRRQRSWARTRVITVFAITTAGLTDSYLQVLSTGLARMLGLAGGAIGLCALVLLWTQRSGSYQRGSRSSWVGVAEPDSD